MDIYCFKHVSKEEDSVRMAVHLYLFVSQNQLTCDFFSPLGETRALMWKTLIVNKMHCKTLQIGVNTFDTYKQA